MFLLVLLFLIFTGIFTAIRFPNFLSRFTSRLRIPRFNFSRAFRNPKIKALLNDRYFFNQNIVKISKGNVFVVLGKNAAKLYDIAAKANGDIDRETWVEKGETEAFAILTVKNTNFIFVHPALYEKNFEENFNSRIRFFIRRLYKVRKQNFIDGIIIAASEHTRSNKKSKPSVEIIEETAFNAIVFQKFSENFKIRLPLFLIQHDFYSQEKFFEKKVQIEAEEETPFGFSCDLLQKPYDQKIEDFIQTSFQDFIEDFELKFQKNMFPDRDLGEAFPRGIESIYIMHYVHSTNAALLHGYLRLFFKNFSQNQDIFPTSLTILNSILFSGVDLSQRFIRIFEYMSENALNKVEISPALLERRRNINILLTTVTLSLGFLFSFSFYKSVQFLNLQRESFEKSLSDFTMLVDSIHSLENEDSEASLELLQESSCRIIKSYSAVKKISFRTGYLFPSWKSDISTKLQKKYKDKFSLLFSNFLFQKYSVLVNETLQSKDKHKSLKESFESFKKYVELMSIHTTAYNQLNSKKPEQINKALISISKVIYENKCVETEESYDFLTVINSENLAEFNKLNNEVRKNASIILEEYANEYFTATLNRNVLMNAFLNLNNDMTDFGSLVDSFIKDTDENDAINIQEALQKTITDYEILLEEFPPNHVRSLVSADEFFGTEFVELMANIKKNTIFENKVYSKLNSSAQETFESFKKQIDITATSQTKNHFPILTLDAKSSLSINPDVVNLFAVLKKFNELWGTSQSSERSFERTSSKSDAVLTDDLHKIASRSTTNISWSDRKLQAAATKYTNLQNQYNTLDFDIYPEIFSEYLQDYIFNTLEKYWSNTLGASLVFNDTNSENNQENLDPHGLISSSNSLKQVIEFLVAEHFDNTLADFDEIYAKQVDDVLKQKTILFDRKELFGENADFKLWDGATSPAFDLFRASSDDALLRVMEKQKQILIDFYTQNIEKNLKAIIPVMQLRPNLRSFYYNRWYSIQQALEDKSKSYQNFSDFVLGDLKKFRTDDCPNILDSLRESGSVGDYFDSRTEYIYQKLSERCRVIYMKTAIENYEELARSFNALLAGKYPFSRSQNLTTQSADIQDVKNILEQFKNFNKEKVSFLLKNSPEFEDRVDILTFISQMSKVSLFFAGDTSQINANFSFRSRKTEEILANRIVDWEIKISDQAYGSLHGNLQHAEFTTKYGDIFRLNLSLAAEVRPKQVSFSDKNYTQLVRNNLVSYTFKDNWALFKFIDEHKTCSDTDGFCSKEKLKFEIPLETGETIVLFCDLNLINAEGKKVLLPIFPTNAPYLTSRRNNSDRTNF